jgi:hypothetical protein
LENPREIQVNGCINIYQAEGLTCHLNTCRKQNPFENQRLALVDLANAVVIKYNMTKREWVGNTKC